MPSLDHIEVFANSYAEAAQLTESEIKEFMVILLNVVAEEDSATLAA